MFRKHTSRQDGAQVSPKPYPWDLGLAIGAPLQQVGVAAPLSVATRRIAMSSGVVAFKRLAAPAALLTVALSATSLESAIAQSNVTGVVQIYRGLTNHHHYLPTRKILSFQLMMMKTTGRNLARHTLWYARYGPTSAVTELANKTTLLFWRAFVSAECRLIVLGGNKARTITARRGQCSPIRQRVSKYRWELQGTRPMNGGRWYPSVTTLPNGEVVVVGGSATAQAT